LGRGVPIDDAVREIGQVIESIVTADEVARLAEQHHLDLPIAFGVRANEDAVALLTILLNQKA
jgi:glycerol-3-phosphate dehydrogenase (NAD(P)+)